MPGGAFNNLELYNNQRGLILGAFVNPARSPRNNQIGGGGRNYIHANRGEGLVPSTGMPSDGDGNGLGNEVVNCHIGLKPGSDSAQGNSGHGILLSDAWGNRIDGCVVSANGKDGIQLTGNGAHHNLITNTIVGLSTSQAIVIGNTWSGIALLNGAGNNALGSAGEHNVIGGNDSGLYVTTNGNVIVDNLMGPTTPWPLRWGIATSAS